MGQSDSYFKELPAMLREKRDAMAEMLKGVGFKPIVPEGGYFMIADTSEFCKQLVVMFGGEGGGGRGGGGGG